jgi:glycosyltransferase EpsF
VAQVIGNVSKDGVEAVVTNYYRAIDKSRIQFDFIIHEDSPAKLPDDILGMGCRVHKVPPYKRLPAYIKALERIFRDGRYEVVHSHMNALSVFALYAAKRAGVPVRIAHSHSTGGKGEFLRNMMKSSLRPFSKVYATHYFACSEHAGRWLFGDKAFQGGKVKIIRNTIRVEKFKYNEEARNRVRDELGLNGKLVVGHVGRFTPQKNQTFLLDVFQEMLKRAPESVLMLVGGGDLLEQAKAKADRLGLSDSVMFLGMRDDVHELYQAMDVFVLPSLYEGLPVSGLEAQCAGLPCVFSSDVSVESNVGGSIEFITLALGSKQWSNQVALNLNRNNRQINSDCFLNFYWNIDICAKELENFYHCINKRILT